LNSTVNIEFAQRLHVTPDQDRGFNHLWETALSAQRALTLYLRALAARQPVSLTHVARAVMDTSDLVTLPDLPAGDTRVYAPVLTVDEVRKEFRVARDAVGWSRTVPATALDTVLVETLREWRAARRSGRVPLSRLPGPWSASRKPELRLDSAVRVVDELTVEIAALGADALVAADVRFLPTRYWNALWSAQQQRLLSETRRLHELEEAWLRGDRDAGTRALRIRARLAAAGLRPGAPVDAESEDVNLPVLREQVSVRRAPADDGRDCWQLVWSFTDPAARPWRRDDCLGVDPGERAVAGYASACQSGLLRRPVPRGVWQLPDMAPGSGQLQVPLDEARARAEARLTVFCHMSPAYEELLALALDHRVVALEDVNWRGFAAQGSSFAEYAEAVGLRSALSWIRALAPAHGVEVRLTPARQSSRTCSRCGRLSARPRAGDLFRCTYSDCGHSEASDINAARVHRWRGLRGEGRIG
jgi:hypothetical protein